MSLAFLCPVGSVRNKNKTTTEEPLKFSKALKDFTSDVHASSDALVQAKMGLAFADPRVWGALVAQFGHIYAALESGLAAQKDHPVLQSLHPFLMKLARGEAFEDDAAFFVYSTSEILPLAPCAAVVEYTARIQHVTKEDPVLLIAYAQAMYMALLSGGQIIRKVQRTAMGLKEADGGSIFIFEHIPAKEQSVFKREFAAALDDLPLDQAAKDRVIQEKRALFPRNDAIVREVVSLAPWTAYFALVRRLVGPFTVGVFIAIPVVWIGVNMAIKR
mmetsp:Transcript_13377/g.18280  ORF Transcript_13377/g.18280 Transcript_13377/m.18280 type:complete len:274 (+) Transcript_13377:292-1113(+)|eukprot:CAMPEP_0196571372 /NCGR_PEP_ID=MMETSP1081-20130531/1547_1 /TAXON_ID=36882 /ORGANISM="Pyramimonas amylifera, Strain CCMP720" /LENGTH=273 /DNA_ID=CAMNT_0041888289 /DNA_START=216 /DNA_END=1037 /DNA_ORIENTATION=+